MLTFVQNPSLAVAQEILDKNKVLIVSGPPGVGKTTLAKMISYYYLEKGYTFHAISKLNDGFKTIDHGEKSVYFFDDFLGRIELNKQALIEGDSAFSKFVKKIQRSDNSYFILTTRGHIYEQAALISDRIDDKRLQLSKYLLNVGIYTRQIRAKILFNHLYASNLSSKHFQALLQGTYLKQIVDHKNYNPRVIASVTSDILENVKPKKIPKANT